MNTHQASEPTTEGKLPLIGRERVLIDKLAKILHTEVRRHYAHAPIREIPRGDTFEVLLPDRRVAKVTIELDRIDTPEKQSD